MRKTIISTAAVTVSALAIGATSGASGDWVLPNKTTTPGVINTQVTQANINTTICKSGWTATIRPGVSYTNKLKSDQLNSTYAESAKNWGADGSLYEEDHLISLQLGGNPTDPKNLWPQPYSGNNARKKDVVETALKRLVCSGKMKLRDAQKIISTNWVDAYNKYTTPADKSNSSNGD
jgi:hypothetical protein